MNTFVVKTCLFFFLSKCLNGSGCPKKCNATFLPPATTTSSTISTTSTTTSTASLPKLSPHVNSINKGLICCSEFKYVQYRCFIVLWLCHGFVLVRLAMTEFPVMCFRLKGIFYVIDGFQTDLFCVLADHWCISCPLQETIIPCIPGLSWGLGALLWWLGSSSGSYEKTQTAASSGEQRKWSNMSKTPNLLVTTVGL